MLVTFLLACGPDSSPAQLRTIDLLMLAVAAPGLLCIAGGVLRIVWHHPMSTSALGMIPRGNHLLQHDLSRRSQQLEIDLTVIHRNMQNR